MTIPENIANAVGAAGPGGVGRQRAWRLCPSLFVRLLELPSLAAHRLVPVCCTYLLRRCTARACRLRIPPTRWCYSTQPQGLAGAPSNFGLYSSILPSFAYAIWGSCGQMVCLSMYITARFLARGVAEDERAHMAADAAQPCCSARAAVHGRAAGPTDA